MKNSFGNALCVTLFGESHGDAVGCVLDGIAPGIKVDVDLIQTEMEKRRGGKEYTTPRKEEDVPVFLSGVKDGYTEGTPVCLIIRNTNAHSADYSKFRDMPRPGHADMTAGYKYRGYEDLRGGGHFSGRLTAALVAAGALIEGALAGKGIRIVSHIESIGDVKDRRFDADHPEIDALNGKDFPVLDEEAGEKMKEVIRKAAEEKDSAGGVIETCVAGLPEGIGEPWFDTLESMLGHMALSVPACKGIEFGDGFGLAGMKGSEANDPWIPEDGKIRTASNHCGGIVGGISDGMPVIFRTVFKPTASIAKPQETLNRKTGKTEVLEVTGRHDPCIAVRAVPVMNAVSALVIADLLTQRYGNLWLGETK